MDVHHPPDVGVTDGVKLKPTEQLVAGGLAGAIAKTVIAPADRVKILYQVTLLSGYG